MSRGAPSLEVLPDNALVRILWYLQDATDIARCRLLNKRWERLSWCLGRLRFVFSLHDSDYLDRGRSNRCADLGKCMMSWLERIKQQGTPILQLSCSMNCTAYDEVMDWLRPAFDTLQRLSFGTDMEEVRQDTCECPRIWKGLALCKQLQVLRLDDYYHEVTILTLQQVVEGCSLLREMGIGVCIDEPGDLKLAHANLEIIRIRYFPALVDAENDEASMRLCLETPKLRYLNVDNMSVNFKDTRELEELHLDNETDYRCKVVVNDSQQLQKLKFLTLSREWEMEDVVGLFKVASSVEEIKFEWFRLDALVQLFDFVKPLHKLRKATFTGQKTLEWVTRGTSWDELVGLKGISFAARENDRVEILFPNGN